MPIEIHGSGISWFAAPGEDATSFRAHDFHDDETTTSYRDETTLCGATPTCPDPGSFSDAQGHAACREHGGVAPRNLPADVRRLVASAATRRDYGAIARILGDADVDLAWLAEELAPRACSQGHVAAESWCTPCVSTSPKRAHALAVDLVRLGVEPSLLVPSLPPATESPRAQRVRKAEEAFAAARAMPPLVFTPPPCLHGKIWRCQHLKLSDDLRECYRRHGEVLAERDALKRRMDELEARVALLEEERDGLAAGLRQALTYDQFAEL